MAGQRLEYTIVWASWLDELASAVNDHISRGWEPLGGPGTTPDPESYDVFQALTRKVPDENANAS